MNCLTSFLRKTSVALSLAAVALTACDDTTDDLGLSLIDNSDTIHISVDTFLVTTRSVVADSVFARNVIGYVGKIKDPETGAYITSNYMSQFHIFDNYRFPDIKNLLSKTADGKAKADSCEIRLYYTDFYGDSLATMKLTAYEMSQPMAEGKRYYSNFDPMAEGLISDGGFKCSKVYTLADQSAEDRGSSSYTPNIRICLDKPYTDKNGATYDNYGTYLMQKFYEDTTNYANFYKFIHNVAPGFYFKHQGGLGSMAYILNTQLNVYFTYTAGDSTYEGTASFPGTEEVLLASNIQNDKQALRELASADTCTYLKTPAGIFTEMTLPVLDIMKGHEGDTINSAKVTLTRINEGNVNKYNLGIPKTLLLLPADSLTRFFENNELADYRNSYLTSYVSTTNTYTFSNISQLVKNMYNSYRNGTASKNWNKVVLVPVTTTSNTLNSTTTITRIVHDLSLANTKLVGGSANPNAPIKISVIYTHQ